MSREKEEQIKTKKYREKQSNNNYITNNDKIIIIKQIVRIF